MIVSSDFKSVIVGFLCEYDKAKNFEDGTWIEITGEITKGNYHGDMPIVKVTEIKKQKKHQLKLFKRLNMQLLQLIT